MMALKKLERRALPNPIQIKMRSFLLEFVNICSSPLCHDNFIFYQKFLNMYLMVNLS